MSPDDLRVACELVQLRDPDAELVKNQVGNLAVISNGEYVGFIDLRTGETWWVQ